MADVNVLEVLLYGNPIGTLTHVAGDRSLFAFNESYIADEQRPILSLGFKDALGGLITDFRPTQARVLPFFSNLLPEGHMRTYLAERAGVNPVREFFLLWALGMDLAGAVTIRPSGDDTWPPVGDSISTDHDDKHRDTALRFSLAGMQLKFSAVTEANGGLTIPAKGIGGSWIIKLPSRQYAGVPENEYSMLTLARLMGMNVPALALVELNDIENLPKEVEDVKGRALVIERFDRLSDGTRVHIEDFAQVFRVYPDKKYEKASMRNIAAVIAAEGEETDLIEFIRRLTFNVLIGNADMHLKNWSLIYPNRRRAALAPAYDFVSTIPYIKDTHSALNVSRTKRFDAFTSDELIHLAAKAALPEKMVLDTARETVALFHQHWANEKKNLPLESKIVSAIDAHLQNVPLAQGQ